MQDGQRLAFTDAAGRPGRRVEIMLWADGSALVSAWAGERITPVQLSAEDVARLVEALGRRAVV
jgi:hypothetical protein